MLARRAKCQLVLAAAQSKSDGDSSSSSAEVPDSGEDRPASSIGLVNLYQSNEKAQTQVVVVLDKAEDGDYLVTFTYAPENMELYNRILQHRVSKLPERRPYEEPRPKVEAPATTNTIGKELCPDRRVLGGIRVEKGMGTLILTDNRFDMFDRVWTPIDGVFSIFPGSEKLGDAKYPDASTELASGRIELDLHHFQSRRDEAALQEAMRPRSMQELVKGTKTTMPLSKAMPLLMAGENRAAFRTLGRFSFAMFLAPLIVFLIVRILAAENPYVVDDDTKVFGAIWSDFRVTVST